MRQFISSMTASEKVRDVMELGQGHFARAIDQRLATLPGHAPPPRHPPLRCSSRQRRLPLLSAQLVDPSRRLDNACPNGHPLSPDALVRHQPLTHPESCLQPATPTPAPDGRRSLSQTPLTGSKRCNRLKAVPPAEANGAVLRHIFLGSKFSASGQRDHENGTDVQAG